MIPDVAAVIRDAITGLPAVGILDLADVVEAVSVVLAVALSGSTHTDVRVIPEELAAVAAELRDAQGALAQAVLGCRGYLPLVEGQ